MTKNEKKYDYHYKGNLHLFPYENEGQKIQIDGNFSESIIDVIGITVKMTLYSNPLTSKEIRFDNPVYDILKNEPDWEAENGFLAFKDYMYKFLGSITLFQTIYEASALKSKSQVQVDNGVIYVDRRENNEYLEDKKAIGGYHVHYGFNRNANGFFPFTNQFKNFLKKQGKYGKETAKKITKEREEDLWKTATKSGETLIWLGILCKCFVYDVFRLKKQKRNQVTALPRESFDKGLKRLLQTPKPIITVGSSKIDYHKKGDNRSLGFIPTNIPDFPNVHPDTIPIIKAGGEIFGSFMSHKLLHFENKLFYDRYRKKVYDFRKLVIDGGYEAILRQLGYSINGRNIDLVKKLLYFQSGFRFTLPKSDGGSKTGNLISLTEHKNKFGKIGSLDIVAGSMLTPESVYTASPDDSGNLLIPFVDIPEKMIGNPATWGAQAFLQMLILEYLTLHSREFFQNGSVLISKGDWERLASEAKMSKACIKRLPEIQEFFCSDENGFLDRQGEEYTVNKKYPEANKHLLEQGKIREKNSKSAKKNKSNKK